MSLATGDRVRVVEGPYVDFVGIIGGLDFEKGKAKVMVSLFGRETPVELDFMQVETL